MSLYKCEFETRVESNSVDRGYSDLHFVLFSPRFMSLKTRHGSHGCPAWLLQDDDYCVVRSFRTTPSRGIVCRGDDQFRRLNVIGAAASVDDPAGLQTTAVPLSSPHQTAGQSALGRQVNEYNVRFVRHGESDDIPGSYIVACGVEGKYHKVILYEFQRYDHEVRMN